MIEDEGRNHLVPESDLIPLDPTCPLCKFHTDGVDYSGHSVECGGCGARLQATDNGERMWLFVEAYPPHQTRGRKVTRRRWTKRGRR